MSKSLRTVPAFVLGALLISLGSSFNQAQEAVKPHVIIPDAAAVSKVTFKAERILAGAPYELKLVKKEEIKPLLTWLKDLGWDLAKSGDARVIRVAPMAFITVHQENKPDMSFTVAEGLIIAGDRHWPIEKAKLEAALKQVREAGK